ncbi:MAG: hypothetical protein ABIK62_04930 [candidate division WOR-3 bacterium]
MLRELAGWQFRLGSGRESDIVAEDRDKVSQKIEVKASGRNGFQNLVDKDMRADYIVWVHFGQFFELTSQRDVRVTVVRDPAKHFRVRGVLKLSWNDFRRTTGATGMTVDMTRLTVSS